MKQIFFSPKTILCVAFAAASLLANAQLWKLTGNSGTNLNTQFLGTTDNQGLVLRTYDSERVRIGAGGNVGIGTKTPKTKLQVDGGSPVSFSSPGYVIIGNPTKYNMVMDYQTIQARYNGSAGNLYLNNYGGSVYAGNSSASYYGLVGYGEDYGLYGYSGSTGVYGTGATYGIDGYSSTGTGVYGSSSSGYGGFFYNTNGIGVYGYDEGTGHGVYGYETGGGEGVDGYAYGSDGYGVLAYSANSFGLYGETSNSSSYAGYFSGNVYSTGTYTGSDEKLKQNISDMTSAMSIINQLKAKTYNFRQDGSYKKMNLPEGQHYGLIAQDLEKVLPGLVKETKFNVDKATHSPEKALDSAHNAKNVITASAKTGEVIDFKAVNYTELIPIMIKAMQEQQQQIDALTQQVATLSAQKSVVPTTPVSLSGAALNQNAPNPFRGSTQISYSLPASFSSAQIIIMDNSGHTLKTIAVSGSGKGNMQLDATSLSAGTYNYSLMVDGKIASTKQMVLAK